MTEEQKERFISMSDKVDSVEDFIYYVVRNKHAEHLTWVDVAKIVNEAYGYSYDESYYRKKYSEDMFAESLSLDSAQTERLKIKEERATTQRYLRSISRIETVKEIALEAAEKVSKTLVLKNCSPTVNERTTEGILCLGDWHYGLDVTTWLNKYNPEVCKKRIAELLKKTLSLINETPVRVMHVVDLGDLIAGRIHKTIQLESRFDVVTQIIEVSEILAQFLYQLSSVVPVIYHSTTDNHSRLEPDKENALEVETLQRITPWYLKTRLTNCNVQFAENTFGPDIITFNTMGHSVMAVHGDKDNHLTASDKLTTYTEKHWDMLLTAHLHHFSGDEKNRCVVLGNGSLCGVESYAHKLRLSSTPSQNLIFVTKENVTEKICRIILN